MSWWHPDKFEKKKNNLILRAKIIKSIRSFFDGKGFLEVETPSLQVSPGLEPHLHAFKTIKISEDFANKNDMYLHTSPEFAMKKLLTAGMEKIYQICHVFRNAEKSSNHSCEFTMIEWYRANDSYKKIMDDCVLLFRSVASECGINEFSFKNKLSNPFGEWEIITVNQAFEKYAGINLEKCLDDIDAFKVQVKNKKIYFSNDDNWDDLFFRVFLELIEPNLGVGKPTIIYEYPASMAALSRLKDEDKRYAERFEIYVCGLELANAFGELTDAKLQKERFEKDIELKEMIYGEKYPIDEDFIRALEYGYPESSGIALGVDRLCMLCTGASDIREVLWCDTP